MNRMIPNGPIPGRQKQKTTVLSLSDGKKNSGNQTDRGPDTRPGWLFDIYIQDSNNNFLELSLKFGSRICGTKMSFSYHKFPVASQEADEDTIDQATKST